MKSRQDVLRQEPTGGPTGGGEGIGGLLNLMPSLVISVYGRKDFAAANALVSPIASLIQKGAFIIMAVALSVSGGDYTMPYLIFIGIDVIGLILPAITLAVWMTATYIRRIRANILEEINKEYVIGLLSKGIPQWKVNLRHVLPNALLSIITMFGMSIGSVLGGATIVETVFSYQGVGKMAADAVTARDYNLMQAYVAWMALIFVFVNLAVDILYRFLDPRIRIGEN
jgi:ABC-type dipeptide/oligopeptide/nickel transport system permease component